MEKSLFTYYPRTTSTYKLRIALNIPVTKTRKVSNCKEVLPECCVRWPLDLGSMLQNLSTTYLVLHKMTQFNALFVNQICQTNSTLWLDTTSRVAFNIQSDRFISFLNNIDSEISCQICVKWMNICVKNV